MAVHPPCPWFTHGRRYRLDNLPDDARAWLAPTWVAQPSAGERSVGHTAGSTWIVISMLATLVGSHAVFSIVVVRDDLLTMRDSSSSSTSCNACLGAHRAVRAGRVAFHASRVLYVAVQ